MAGTLKRNWISLAVIAALALVSFAGAATFLPRPPDAAGTGPGAVDSSLPDSGTAPSGASQSGHKATTAVAAEKEGDPSPSDPPVPASSAVTSTTTTPAPPERSAAAPSANPRPSPAPPMVLVHVAGMVQRPNVYRLPATDRVVDALRWAGGARPGADLDSVNLAAPIQDGEQLYIPPRAVATPPAPAPRASGARMAVSSVPATYVPMTRIPAGRMPLAGPQAFAFSGRSRRAAAPALAGASLVPGGAAMPGPEAPDGRGRSSRSQKLSDPSQGGVDLNTAAAEELVKLPGVGPSTAAKILEFRTTNGKFNSPEDIMNVKGIGPAKFAKMRPFLIVH